MLISLSSLYVKALSVALLIACLLRARVRAYHVRWVAAGAAALVLLHLYIVFQVQPALDHRIFWRVGRDLWEGLEPYDPIRFSANPFLNPPTALPLFALFATVPYRSSMFIWTIVNVLICAALPALAVRALSAQERLTDAQPEGPSRSRSLPRLVLVALTSSLIVSDAVSYGLFTGQLGLLTALALLAALESQGRGRPMVAGVWLGVATIKVSTMLPFLILFLRRRDLRTWITLGLTCSALCLLGGSPTLLPSRVSRTLQEIEALSAPGQVNDYSFQGTQHATMIGFDHALYRLGLRDRSTIRTLQLIAVVLMGLWVVRLGWASRLPRPAVCSLVALYSIVFFYHRIYDTVVLVLPLVYSVSRSQVAEARSRWLFVASSLVILMVLFMSASDLKSLTESSLKWGVWGRLVQATMTAYATWMVVAAMACIYIGDVRRVRPAGHC
jgi:hypothetical protein